MVDVVCEKTVFCFNTSLYCTVDNDVCWLSELSQESQYNTSSGVVRPLAPSLSFNTRTSKQQRSFRDAQMLP